MSAQEGKNLPEAGCLGQKIPGKSLRSLRGEKVPEVLRLQNFSPTGQKTKPENFRVPERDHPERTA